MWKTISATAMFATVCLLSTTTNASERATSGNGNLSPEILARFGLEKMDVLSDQQGTEIRGSGVALFFVKRWFLLNLHHHDHGHKHVGGHAKHGPHHHGKGHAILPHHGHHGHKGFVLHPNFNFIFHRFARLHGGHDD